MDDDIQIIELSDSSDEEKDAKKSSILPQPVPVFPRQARPTSFTQMLQCDK